MATACKACSSPRRASPSCLAASQSLGRRTLYQGVLLQTKKGNANRVGSGHLRKCRRYWEEEP